jgi:hypothetical protein
MLFLILRFFGQRRTTMRLLLLLCLTGLVCGLPHPQEEAASDEAAEEDEEYDVYEALEDAAEGQSYIFLCGSGSG